MARSLQLVAHVLLEVHMSTIRAGGARMVLLFCFYVGACASEPVDESETHVSSMTADRDERPARPEESAAPPPAHLPALPREACRADGACRLVARTGRASVQNPAFSP